MGQEGYGTAMHAAEDLTDGDLLMEPVKKYAERATQVEEHMAQMEENSEEKNRHGVHAVTVPDYILPSPPHRTLHTEHNRNIY